MVWSIKEDTQTENKIWVLPCRSPARDLEQAKFPHEILEFTHNLSNVSSHQNLHKRTYSITQMIIKVEKTVSYMLLGWCKTQKNQRSNCQYPLEHRKRKKIPEKQLLLFHWLCWSLWLCASQQTVENSSTDRNTRLPYLPPEKSVCRTRSNS